MDLQVGQTNGAIDGLPVVDLNPESRTLSDRFDQKSLATMLHRADSRELIGTALTRQKSKEVLGQLAGQAATDCRLTRSQSKELIGLGTDWSGADLLRDSSLGRLSFDLSDLGGPVTVPTAIPQLPVNQCFGDSVGIKNIQQCDLNRSESHKTVLLGTDLLRDSSFGRLTFDMSDLIAADLFPEAVPPPPTAAGLKRELSQTAVVPGFFTEQKKAKNELVVVDGAIEPDPWIGNNVILTRGKYTGRTAFVLGKASKKYRVCCSVRRCRLRTDSNGRCKSKVCLISWSFSASCLCVLKITGVLFCSI